MSICIALHAVPSSKWLSFKSLRPLPAAATMLVLSSMLSLDLFAALKLLAASGLVYYAGWIIYARFFHPLRRFPGPFLASFTDWWYFLSARYAVRKNTTWLLHQKYGKIVRIRPGAVSISDPYTMDVVFSFKKRWETTEFYDSCNPRIPDGVEIFSLRDETQHVERRRVVAHLWTVAALTEYEPRIDRIVNVFREKLSQAASSGKTVTLDRMLSQYALDIIGEIFYGKEGGFDGLRTGIDYKNWGKMLNDMIGPLSVLGLVPRGFKTLYLFSQLLSSADTRAGLKAHDTVTQDAYDIVEQRLKEQESRGDALGNEMVSKMLSIAARPDNKIPFTQGDITAWVYDV